MQLCEASLCQAGHRAFSNGVLSIRLMALKNSALERCLSDAGRHVADLAIQCGLVAIAGSIETADAEEWRSDSPLAYRNLRPGSEEWHMSIIRMAALSIGYFGSIPVGSIRIRSAGRNGDCLFERVLRLARIIHYDSSRNRGAVSQDQRAEPRNWLRRLRRCRSRCSSDRDSQ